jgi:hypothetical protein
VDGEHLADVIGMADERHDSGADADDRDISSSRSQRAKRPDRISDQVDRGKVL